MNGSPDNDGRPDPSAAATVAEFLDAMRRLKTWSGVGFRRLERLAMEVGEALPRSTITAALNRDVLPREDLVVALVRTCGGDQEEVGRWVAARRRIAAGVSPLATESVPETSEPPSVPQPASRTARLAAAAAMLAVTVILVGADAGLRTAGGPLPRPPSPPTGSASQPVTEQRPLDRALALFASADRLARAGMVSDAQAACLDAVQLYSELVRVHSERNGPPLAGPVIEALNRIGVDFSIPEPDLRDWLVMPNDTPYPAIAEALLRSGWRLMAPVYLDVIAWNYEHAPGVASPRQLAEVRLDVLEAAILEGSNVRHGTQVAQFAQLLVP